MTSVAVHQASARDSAASIVSGQEKAIDPSVTNANEFREVLAAQRQSHRPLNGAPGDASATPDDQDVRAPLLQRGNSCQNRVSSSISSSRSSCRFHRTQYATEIQWRHVEHTRLRPTRWSTLQNRPHPFVSRIRQSRLSLRQNLAPAIAASSAEKAMTPVARIRRRCEWGQLRPALPKGVVVTSDCKAAALMLL